MGTDYVYAWEFVVRPECRAEFERAYGPDGDWVRLFRRASGHVSTDLLRDRGRPDRFVTIDRWKSREAWDSFRSTFSAEYEALDAQCAGLTVHERELGCFDRVASAAAATVVVRAFVACINRHDVAALGEMMTDDHVFVDGLGGRVEGRDAMIDGWRCYFALVPDYCIVVEQEFSAGDAVALFGTAGGTYAPDGVLRPGNAWSVPAAWRAIVRDGKIAVWQVCADNKRMHELVAANAGSSG
ncbi:MAG: nuclear transport factor 2 family protein [Deltaproteobacteria bacterium]|nr:nuclear transport factor 2 family protein [Deltaproteobacteria bacterium]